MAAASGPEKSRVSPVSECLWLSAFPDLEAGVERLLLTQLVHPVPATPLEKEHCDGVTQAPV